MSTKKASGKPLTVGVETKVVDPWFQDAAVVANTRLSIDKKEAEQIAQRTLEAITRPEGRQR